MMKVSVVISTYNSPEWLEKVLWGYENQTYRNFELVIADDGSGEETRDMIDRFKTHSGLEVIHVWHEDRGFQKSEILNKAIQACTSVVATTDGRTSSGRVKPVVRSGTRTRQRFGGHYDHGTRETHG